MKAKLVKGNDLTPEQIKEIKSAFGYRRTIENEARCRIWTSSNAIATQTDEQWIAEHAFYIRKDGKLAVKPGHCEPVYMADYTV